MSEKFERQLSIGVGQKELAKERETLPAVEVANEVVWVNKEMEIPFDIKKGESNCLGMFLIPGLKKTDKGYNLEMRPEHRRSGILGRVIFKDKEGRLYRDVDLKGIGYSHVQFGRQKVHEPEISYDPAYPDETKTLGILDRSFAENDIKMAEKFLKSGVRTYRPIALIELGEIFDKNGEKISVKKAKERDLIKNSDEPVVEVRAFGTRTRVGDLFDIYNQIQNDPETETLLEDAIKLVAQEQGINPKNFSKEDYFNWFKQVMGINVARMHNKKWVHGYLTGHNITLDARIVDLDSVETVAEIKKRDKDGERTTKSVEEDVKDLIFVIGELGKALGLEIKPDIRQEVRQLYKAELSKLG